MKKINILLLVGLLLAVSLVAVQCRQPESFTVTPVAPKATETEAPKATEAATEAPKATEAATEAPKPTEAATEAAKPTEAATEAPKPTEAATEAAKPTEAATEAPVALDGATLLQERCTKCHDLKRVEAAKKTADEWKSTVERMVSKGAQLTAEEQKVLIEYLAATYKAAAAPETPAATEAPAKVTKIKVGTNAEYPPLSLWMKAARSWASTRI
jgi:hypothetical protein